MNDTQPLPTPPGDGTPQAGGPTGTQYAGATSGPAAGGPSGASAGASSGASAGGRYAGGPYTGGPYTGGPYTSGPSGQRPAGAPVGTGFFDSIRGAGMVRPDDRVAAGVAAAVAGRLRIDPLLVRIGFVVLAIVGGVGVFLYGLGWLLLPQQDGRIHAQSLLSGSVTAGTVGAGVTIALGFGNFGSPWGWDGGPDVGGFIALVSIVLVIVIFLVGNSQGWFGAGRASVAGTGPGPDGLPPADPSYPYTGSADAGRIDMTKPGATAWQSGTPTPPPPPPPPVAVTPPPPPKPSTPRRKAPGALGTLLAAGLALVAAGAVVVADSIDPLTVDVGLVAWASALAVLAACLLVVGLAGRRSGGIAALAVVALIATTASSVTTDVRSGENVGDRRWTPSGELDSYRYELAAGEADLDLSDLRPRQGAPIDIEVDLSVGELRVQVPDDLTVAVDATSGVGSLEGVSEGESVIGPAGSPDVTLDVDVSVGSLVIQEVSR